MKTASLLTVMAFWLGPISPTHAIHLRVDTEKVPISRLIANLEKRVGSGTNIVEDRYALARIHSIAYAQNTEEFDVRKDDGRPFFGYSESSRIPRVTREPTGGATNQHLQAAIRDYRAVVAVNTNHLYAWMGLGWCLQQAGERDGALKAYRPALELAWKSESRLDSLPVGGCATEEIAGYMLPLLDPQKDAQEIAKVEKYQKDMKSKGRWITPILVPIRSGTELTDLVAPNAAVPFDLDGSGLPRRWGWITTNAAWLVFDHDGSGRITSGLQLFGNVTFWVFWRDGYAALASLDDDGDGMLRGAELNGLALWHDLNANGISEPGEVRAVTSWSVRALSTQRVTHGSGIPFSPVGVEFEDDTTRPTYDWIAPAHSP